MKRALITKGIHVRASLWERLEKPHGPTLARAIWFLMMIDRHKPQLVNRWLTAPVPDAPPVDSMHATSIHLNVHQETWLRLAGTRMLELLAQRYQYTPRKGSQGQAVVLDQILKAVLDDVECSHAFAMASRQWEAFLNAYSQSEPPKPKNRTVTLGGVTLRR